MCIVLPSHIRRLVQVPTAPLLTMCPVNQPEKAADDGQNSWASAALMGKTVMEFLSHGHGPINTTENSSGVSQVLEDISHCFVVSVSRSSFFPLYSNFPINYGL